MQRKFIESEECRKNILPKEKLIFSTRSPVSSISLPPTTIFIAMHGNLTVYGTQGTMYVCRVDYGDKYFLNIDAYSFNSKLYKEEIKGPVEHEHHWVPDIPIFIKKDAPEWAKDEIKKVLSFTK